jgi:hypothetical protein
MNLNIYTNSLLSHKVEVVGVGAGSPANKCHNTMEIPVRGRARSYTRDFNFMGQQ